MERERNNSVFDQLKPFSQNVDQENYQLSHRNSKRFQRISKEELLQINQKQEQIVDLDQQKEGEEINQQQEKDEELQKETEFTRLIKRLKRKILARKIAMKLRTRMFKYLKKLHFNMLNDYESVSNLKEKSGNNDILDYHHFIKLNVFERLKVRLKRSRLVSYYQNFPVIKQSSKLCLLWEFIQLINSYFLIFIISYYFCTDKNVQNILSQEAVMVSQIILGLSPFYRLNISYYKKGYSVTDRLKITKIYFNNYFFKDIVVNTLLGLNMHYHYNKNKQDDIQSNVFLKFSLILAIFYLLRQLNFLKKIEERWLLSFQIRNALEFLKLLLFILLIAHFLATLWIFIARINEGADQTWLKKYEIQDDSFSVQYIYAYYFSCVTMITVGYGDLLPTNLFEMVACIFIMLFSCGVFGYALNQVGSIIQDFFRSEKEIENKLYIINKFMQKKGITLDLQMQIREYLQYYWKETDEEAEQSEQKIIGQLTESLRNELFFQSNKMVLEDSKIFKDNFNSTTLKQTIPLIKPLKYAPDQVVCEIGGFQDQSVYFIEKGTVEIYFPQKNGKDKIISTLKKGQTFGAYGFFSNQKRLFSVRCKEFCIFLVISRNEFTKLLAYDPHEIEKLHHIQDSLVLNQNYEIISQGCTFCNSKEHNASDCSMVHYTPNRYRVILKEKYQKNSRDLKFKRNEKRKKTNSVSLIQEYLEPLEEFKENYEDIISNYDEIVENEEDYAFFTKKIENIYENVPEYLKNNINFENKKIKVLNPNSTEENFEQDKNLENQPSLIRLKKTNSNQSKNENLEKSLEKSLTPLFLQKSDSQTSENNKKKPQSPTKKNRGNFSLNSNENKVYEENEEDQLEEKQNESLKVLFDQGIQIFNPENQVINVNLLESDKLAESIEFDEKSNKSAKSQATQKKVKSKENYSRSNRKQSMMIVGDKNQKQRQKMKQLLNDNQGSTGVSQSQQVNGSISEVDLNKSLNYQKSQGNEIQDGGGGAQQYIQSMKKNQIILGEILKELGNLKTNINQQQQLQVVNLEQYNSCLIQFDYQKKFEFYFPLSNYDKILQSYTKFQIKQLVLKNNSRFIQQAGIKVHKAQANQNQVIQNASDVLKYQMKNINSGPRNSKIYEIKAHNLNDSKAFNKNSKSPSSRRDLLINYQPSKLDSQLNIIKNSNVFIQDNQSQNILIQIESSDKFSFDEQAIDIQNQSLKISEIPVTMRGQFIESVRNYKD